MQILLFGDMFKGMGMGIWLGTVFPNCIWTLILSHILITSTHPHHSSINHFLNFCYVVGMTVTEMDIKMMLSIFLPL